MGSGLETAVSVKSTVRDHFGPAAAGYAVSAVHRGGPDLDAMIAAAHLEGGVQPGRLLDVGTGAGHTAFAFAPRIARVDALDLTAEMLEQVAVGARERGLGNIHCQLGDAEALPYPDRSFDLVTSRLCAHHFEDARAFVSEAARVLKPDGVLLIVDSLAPEDASSDTFFNAFELLRDPSHVRNYSRSDWRSMLNEGGFVPEVEGETFMLHQDFDGWVSRIGAPVTAVAHLHQMFATAGDRRTRTFAIRMGDGGVESLAVPCGLLRARLR